MSFDNIKVLYFLFCPLFSVFIMAARYRKSRKSASSFAAAAVPGGDSHNLGRELKKRMIISDIFFLFFTCFCIVALAGPRWGIRLVADYRRSVDIILAFDLSQSMNVRDSAAANSAENISRLERSTGIAAELVGILGDVRLGAAIGKGRGVLAVPLTYDSGTILSFLYGLDSRSVTGSGTNLESLINAASASFHDNIPHSRAIVLFSDGENLSGSFQSAVEKARRAGISISSAGVGRDSGSPVPVEKGPLAPGGFLLDADGTPVISARQSSALKMAAEKTGGIYVDGSRIDTAAALASYINSLTSESRLSGHRREANPRWQVFILLSLACYGGGRIMGFNRRRSHKGTERGISKGAKGRKILAALACIFLFNSCTKAQGKLLIMEGNFFNSRGFYLEAISSYLKALEYDEVVPYAEYGLGSAYFALEEGEAALERYRTAEREIRGEDKSELKYRIYYNTGIIFFERGEYDEAAKAFRNALKMDNSRIEAKRNLELSLLTLERSSPPQAASSERKAENASEGEGGGSSALFEYLREMEQEQWRSREWLSEGESSGPDY